MHCVTHVLSWKYSRALVMDGNFKAKHMLLKNASQELWLMDGKGFMVTSEPYNRYLAGSVHQVEVRVIHYRGILSHHAVNQANSKRTMLASTGIGGCACARHGCFMPHGMVDFQKGEQ